MSKHTQDILGWNYRTELKSNSASPKTQNMRKDLIEHTCPTIANESDVLFDKNNWFTNATHLNLHFQSTNVILSQ